jgi:hypothetical protein
MISRAIVSAFLALLCATPVLAVDTRYETVLLPLYDYPRTVAGAFGSSWRTTLWMRNDNPFRVDIGPCAPGFPDLGPGRACLGEPASIASRTTSEDPVFSTPARPEGRLIYLRRDQLPENVHFRLEVEGPAHGVEIPVVRSAAFRTAVAHLMNVRLSQGTRSLLRVYDLDDRGDASRINVRVFALSNGGAAEQLVGERLAISFEPSLFANPPDDLPRAPSVVTLDPAALVAPGLSGPFRIEIEPATPLRFWAFVTTTDNATQAVTVVTP